LIDSPFGELLPWRRVRDWSCSACGDCCKLFEVPLSPYELARIMAFGGASKVRFEHGRAYLSRRWDGRCAFQERLMGLWICSLADRKPTVCKLWPFHIFDRPSYGKGGQAEYEYEGRKLYIYVNSSCPNLMLGPPTERLTSKVLPEILGMAFGEINSQRYSTGDLAARIRSTGLCGVGGSPRAVLRASRRRMDAGARLGAYQKRFFRASLSASIINLNSLSETFPSRLRILSASRTSSFLPESTKNAAFPYFS
jgi:Fe-S-cluster containining protein